MQLASIQLFSQFKTLMTHLLGKQQHSSSTDYITSLATNKRPIKRWISPAPPPAPLDRLPQKASAEINLSLEGFKYSYRFYTHPSFTASPVFFISGAFQNMKSWKNHADYFYSRGVPVILADLPGTGDSDPLPAEYGLNFLAEALRIVIDDIGIHKVFIIAASYGTPIAYSFAAQYPDRVSKLILAGTMKEVPAHMKQRVANTLIPLREGRMEQFAKEVAEGLVVMDESVPVRRRDLSYRLLRAQLSNMTADETRKYMFNTHRVLSDKPVDLDAPPQCPTLVFTGEYDSFTTPADCMEIANAISCSYFTTIKNADHLFHIQQPSVVNRIFYDFLLKGRLSSKDGLGPLLASGFSNSSSLPEPLVAS